MWHRRVTTIYLAALLVLAALAGIGYFLPQAELRVQQSSAAILHSIDRQYTLLELTALLAQLLVYSSDAEQQNQLRNELRQELNRMTEKHAMIRDATPHVVMPVELDRQMRAYLDQAWKLIDLSASELALDHPIVSFMSSQATGSLAQHLEAFALNYQQRDEDGIQRLRFLQFSVLMSMLAALALIGLFVFRPLVRRVRLEQEERLRAERLAVIGAMAAKFAHEIRNPLGSIRLNFDSVRDELDGRHGLPRTLPSLFGSIDAELQRVQRISDGYLQFGRLPKTNLAPLSLNDWLTRRLGFCAAELAQRGVRLQTELTPNLPPVMADANTLWQAALNIIRNAIEAMPDGGTLTVRTATARAHARLDISDTGHGMTEDEQREVFKPFVSLKTNGTGLGLSLAQQIVIEHCGRIECHSRPGEGATFSMYLPLAISTNNQPSSAIVTDHSAAASRKEPPT